MSKPSSFTRWHCPSLVGNARLPGVLDLASQLQVGSATGLTYGLSVQGRQGPSYLSNLPHIFKTINFTSEMLFLSSLRVINKPYGADLDAYIYNISATS